MQTLNYMYIFIVVIVADGMVLLGGESPRSKTVVHLTVAIVIPTGSLLLDPFLG